MWTLRNWNAMNMLFKVHITVRKCLIILCCLNIKSKFQIFQIHIFSKYIYPLELVYCGTWKLGLDLNFWYRSWTLGSDPDFKTYYVTLGNLINWSVCFPFLTCKVRTELCILTGDRNLEFPWIIVMLLIWLFSHSANK